MAALDYICRVGLSVEAIGDKLRVTPRSLITDAIGQFVRDHKAEILAELAVANDAELRRNAWQVTRNGKSICQIVGEPMTYDEALAVAHWRWPEADIVKE
jgi:hypothetical protein